MNPERHALVSKLFLEACELEPAQRKAFLDQACEDDPELRKQVAALLAKDVETRGMFERDTMEAATSLGSGERPEQIDSYKILERIGEGGMGVVYLAEQTEPVRRRVALKIIKVGMDTREVVTRFEAERQALALMDHPCVAKVLDAGATETGRPYFVMEHVPGVPITEHCDHHRLNIVKRLDLFMQVCDALQHAHQKGLIHRDLKPSNILVAVRDGSAMPKVIDFGVAKALHQKLTEKTLFTEQGQLIGTPEYMSPEQAEMTVQDIDTRSDIYSLGVVLYELLTGVLPFEPSSLRAAAFAEIQRIIREQEPQKPSTKLSSLSASTASARNRGLDMRSLERQLRGDLDWIVMKAMEKDRTRRYETANGLAADIRRHLNHEPVIAGPPSAAYQLSKFVRRNRAGVIAASIVSAGLVISTVISIGFALSEAKQRGVAETKTIEANANLALANSAREAESIAKAEAEQRAEELGQIAEFQASQLSDIDVELMAVRLREDILGEARAAMDRSGLGNEEVAERTERLERLLTDANLTNVALRTLDRNIFERALEAVDEQFEQEDLVRARLLQTIANTLREVGLLDAATAPQTEALTIRRRMLGDEHMDTLTSVHNMGFLLDSQGRYAEAEPYYREAYEGLRRIGGDENSDTLFALSNLGSVIFAQGRYAEAEPYIREALAVRRRVFGDEYLDTLHSVSNMGGLLRAQGRLAEAEPYYREAIGGHRRVLGDDHPHTLHAINNMGVLLQTQSKFAEAEPYIREALDARRRIYGDRHPDTLSSVHNMGLLLHHQGKLAEAEPYYSEALEGLRRVLGNDHPDTLTSINDMGVLLKAQGKLAEAEPYYREALDGHRRLLGEEHPSTLRSINNMGGLLCAQGKPAEAEPYYREALRGLHRLLGDEHQYTLASTNNLSRVLNAQRRYAESEQLVRANLPINERVFGEDDWRTAEARSILGAALVGLEQYPEAEPLLLDGYSELDRSLPDGRRRQKLPPAIERLMRLYEAWGKPDKAAEWRAKLEELEQEQSSGSDG